MKRILLIAILFCIYSPTFGQNQLGYLRNWVGKTPLNLPGETPRNIYTSRPLARRLRRLLGPKNYARLVNDYYEMGQVELIGNYVVVDRCERHNCDESSSFMAVNVRAGDIHVAFYRLGELEWFHTKGKARDLPRAVLNHERLESDRPFVRHVTEITRPT